MFLTPRASTSRLFFAAIVGAFAGCAHHPDPTPAPHRPQNAVELAEPVATHFAAHLADVTAHGWQPAPLEAAIARLAERDDWEDHGRPLDLPRHPAQKYLDGMVVVLDPGHGGKADVEGYKRGPTGVREAEMNLRIAKLLRALLEDAGVTVTLTREDETSEAADDRRRDTHRRRAEIANRHPRPDGGVGADLFISLHHNAVGNPTTNWPSVWFHGEVDWSETSLDPARYVGHRLGAELRCAEVGKTGILMSDQQMYGSGFAVLRHAEVPAFLIEASFFTHPEEEQRLRDAAYNLREAWAIYLGLVEYAYGGRPTQTTPQVTRDGDELVVTTTLSEGQPGWWGSDRQRTLSSTISAFFDGERMAVSFEPQSKLLTARAPWPTDGGESHLRIHHANFYKHHNWPQRYAVELGAQGATRVLPMHTRRAGEE